MHRKINQLVICGTLLTLALVAVPEQARAAYNGDGYICTVYHNPYATTSLYGEVGYIFISLHEAPNCDGRYLGWGWFFSEGATHPDVDRDRNLYPESMFGSFYQTLIQTADAGNKVRVTGSASTNQLYLIFIDAK